MKFCSECGSKVFKKIPKGDNRERKICESCSHIFYESPKIVVVCIPQWQNRILLCKRAIEPQKGEWCLPGGYLESKETLEDGAKREVLEETFAKVENLKLFSKAELIHLNLIMFCFFGQMKDDTFDVGEECLDVRLFNRTEVQNMKLAFNAHKFSLDAFFESSEIGNIHNFRIEND
jgi:NADH pyrophosphatase NudC (nudix superfamily)